MANTAASNTGGTGNNTATTTNCDSYTNAEQKKLCETLQAQLPQKEADKSYAESIFNVAYGIGGLIAVVMIIVGAIQYITSSGDAGKATKAKNTITYSIIGLVVIILATVITNFVIGVVSGAK